jgi:hypothetical protein
MNFRLVTVRHFHDLSVDFSWISAMNTRADTALDTATDTGGNTATDTGGNTARTQAITGNTRSKGS